jgi:putative ABC transport system permease protein
MARTQSVNLTGIEAPDRLVGTFVTANTLRILGAHAAMGRLFTTEETTQGTAQQVAVLSNPTWRTRFGGDSAIVGRTLVLNGRPHVVIGVLAADYRDPLGDMDVWLPITSAPNPQWFTRGNTTVWAFGRLKPGVTIDAARADLARVTRELAAEYPQTNAGIGATVLSLRETLVGDVKPSLLIVLAFVGVVLLIACANVANLQLARAAARRREMSMRAALGAGRWRLVRQLLTESLVLSAVGGWLGVVLAHWLVKGLLASMPIDLPTFGAVGIDLTVLGFSAGITIVAGLLFGLAPALHAARADLHESLQMRAPEGGPRGRGDTRNLLVALELALCIVLLVGAGLLTRSLGALTRVDPGYQAPGLLTAEFRLPQARYDTDEKINTFMARTVAAIRAVPGVSSAALLNAIPLSGNWGTVSYVSDAHPDVPPERAPQAQQNSGSDKVFSTMGIRMIAGRDFGADDRQGTDMVAIVNEELARREWPGQSALGKRLKLIGPPDQWVSVVGVVGNIRHLSMSEPPTPQIYQPKAQTPGIFSSIVVRTEGDPMALARSVRAALWSVDPDQPVWKMRTLTSLMERNFAPPRFTMMLTLAFALLALVLAAIGVYGVMSYAVVQRTRELGIRMALGARRATVVRLVMGRGLRVVGVATVLGIVASLGAAQLIRKQLFGVSAQDPVTFVGVPLVLAFVALVACYLPARRASRVDPVIALRSE